MTHLTQQLKLAAAVALALSTLAPLAQAEDKKPDDEVTFNASVASTYRYRGIGQTREKPALQGGADYVNNPTGFYLGTWLSTIKWIKDAGGDSNVEWDIYGGKRGELAKDVNYDVGFLSYVYAGNGLKPSANTTEIYGQVSFGPAYAKYSHSTTNLFGFANSKNSGYLDLGANFDIAEGLQLNLHAGHQGVKNNSSFAYNDYKVGLTKDLGFASLSGAIIGTDSDAYTGPGGKNLGKATLVVILTKTF